MDPFTCQLGNLVQHLVQLELVVDHAADAWTTSDTERAERMAALDDELARPYRTVVDLWQLTVPSATPEPPPLEVRIVAGAPTELDWTGLADALVDNMAAETATPSSGPSCGHSIRSIARTTW
ncbi:MAG: hypothetical protein AB7L13_24960 [Acidimicrobiia bacterium]